MGHAVEYVLDLVASDFAKSLPHEFLHHDGFWEGSIPDGNGCLMGFTNEFITCMSYAEIKYSWLVHEHAESLDRVAKMDAALIKLFPNARILRIDEFLLNNWELRRGESFRSSCDEFDLLLEWLHSQEQRHWQIVSV